jgi:hypothetical protein
LSEEYYNWEDETRLTFIELAKFMEKNANPLDYVLSCCEQGLVPQLFDVKNAKDELKRLRESKDSLSVDMYNAKLNSAEDARRWLDCETELAKLKESFKYPIAWGMTNEHGDLFDLRLQNNPYNDQTKVVPLYCNREEFKYYYDNLPK